MGVKMKKLLLLVFLLNIVDLLIAQQLEVKLLTNLPVNCKRPSLSYTISPYEKWLIFEGWDGSKTSRLYIMNYDPYIDSFYFYKTLGDESFQNVNPSQDENFDYLPEVIVVWQFYRNGNFDLVASSSGFAPPWSNYVFLTNTPDDEINPSFSRRFPPSNLGVLITYVKTNSVYLLFYNPYVTKNELIFEASQNKIYKDPTAWIWADASGNIDGYVAAIEQSDSVSKLVYRYKMMSDSVWSNIYTAFDSGSCSNPKFFNAYLTFESVINGKRQVYYFDDLDNLGKNYLAKRLNNNETYETSNFYALVTGTRGDKKLLENPHTYKVIRNDSVFIYVMGGRLRGLKDTLIYLRYPDSKPTIGVVEYQNAFYTLITLTVWEDSINGKLALFGMPREDFLVTANIKSESKLDVLDFALFQNYPNPFNSSTKIKYSIKESGIVTLKVYDLLGREITTLVNEPKQPGEYEVEFDADKYNLTSGVYIYQLKSGSFIQSRKFVLMK